MRDYDGQIEKGCDELQVNCKWATSDPDNGIQANYNFVPMADQLNCVLTDLIPTQLANCRAVIVSLWVPGCLLQLYYLQLIFPLWFRSLLLTF